MDFSQKATGWKVPLLFCLAILLAGFIGYVCLPEKKDPDVPQALLAQARSLHIDLDTPQGREWKEAITNAASGFSTPEQKDRKLAGIIETALEARQFDAACTAGVLIKQAAMRDGMMKKIFMSACDSCDTLPWAVFALRGMTDSDLAVSMAIDLGDLWKKCEK